MSKIIRTCIIAFTIIFSTISISEINTKMAFAEEQVSDSLVYSNSLVYVEDGDTIKITGYKLNDEGVIKMDDKEPGIIVIPQEINEKSVTAIADGAFSNCNSLLSIEFPDSIKTIGNNAFKDCGALTSITLPQNLFKIGDFAFENCSNVTSISIPSTVETIGDCAFGGCKSLENINVNELNNNYCSEAGVLYNKNKDTIYQVPAKISNIIIPDSIKTIGNYAFSGCDTITSINIKDSVETIGNFAFKGCQELKEITLPQNITAMGDCPFIECSKLEKINVSENNENYCSLNGILYSKDKKILIEAPIKSSTIEIPDTVEIIKKYAFKDCSDLTNFKMPQNINTIEDEAFYGCSSLNTIIIPKRDETITIGSKAFASCYSLKYALLLGENFTVCDDSFEDCFNLKIFSYKNDSIKNHYADEYMELEDYSEDKCPITLSTDKFTNKDIKINEESKNDILVISGNDINTLIGNNISTNGTYKLLFTVGSNAYIKDVEITNIDKINPEIEVKPFSTELTNKDIELDIAGKDDNFSYIEMPDGTKVENTNAKFTVTKNGDYIFKVYDKAGNVAQTTITIDNIDKTAPELTYSLDEENPTNKEIVVIVSTNHKDFDYMILPDGKKTDKNIAGFKASKNGTYIVKAYDKLGNETIKEININNIGHKVVFKDYDGKILNTQIVVDGNKALSPNPLREGYTFIGFDKDISSIKSDIEVTALYEINKYNVVFKDYDGKELKKEVVEYKKSATAPQNPAREGYTFKGYDKDFSTITENTVVNAIYEINKYKVLVNGVEQLVEYGKNVVLPSVNPTKEGYTFKGWSGQTTNIKADGIVNPIFEKNRDDNTDKPSGGDSGTDKPSGGDSGTDKPSGGDSGTDKPSSGDSGIDKPSDNPGTGQSSSSMMALAFSALSLAFIKKCKKKIK